MRPAHVEAAHGDHVHWPDRTTVGYPTLPTDAERAQARAEHLAAIADCFELEPNGTDATLIAACLERLYRPYLLPTRRYDPDEDEVISLVDLDEARAIRDRLAELIEDAETGGVV